MIIFMPVPDISALLMIQATQEHGCPGLSWTMDPTETILGKCSWTFYHAECRSVIKIYSPGWNGLREVIQKVEHRFHQQLNPWR